MHRGTAFADDVELREEGVVRIYDIFFDYEVLLSTDAYIREVSAGPEFQRSMSTAEYHYLLGGYILQREQALGISRKSLLGVAHECGVPIYTSSPGDSSIGMNVAEQAPAASPGPRLQKRSAGARWTPTSCRTRWSATSTIRSASPCWPPTRSPSGSPGACSACITSGRR